MKEMGKGMEHKEREGKEEGKKKKREGDGRKELKEEKGGVREDGEGSKAVQAD